MSKIRTIPALTLLIALFAAFIIPATAQSNPTKTPKPTNTVQPTRIPKASLTPKPSLPARPSITPKGFVAIPTRADDFGGGGTILFSPNRYQLLAMDASGKNARVALNYENNKPLADGTYFFVESFQGDADTIVLQGGQFGFLYLTDLKARKLEKLPSAEKVNTYVLSPDHTQIVFNTSPSRNDFQSGDVSLVAYNIATGQSKELARGAKETYFALLGWIDGGKRFVAGEYADPINPLNPVINVRAYDVTDASSLPFEVNGLNHPFVRSSQGKFAFCGDGFLGLLDITSGTQTQVVVFPAGEQCLVRPAWSPDGKYVLVGLGVVINEVMPPSLAIQAVNIETKELTLIQSYDKRFHALLSSLEWSTGAP